MEYCVILIFYFHVAKIISVIELFKSYFGKIRKKRKFFLKIY